MEARTYEERIIENLRRLNDEDKGKVLELVQRLGRLSRPKGEPLEAVFSDAQQLDFSKDDLAEIAATIKQGREQIDIDEWDLSS